MSRPGTPWIYKGARPGVAIPLHRDHGYGRPNLLRFYIPSQKKPEVVISPSRSPAPLPLLPQDTALAEQQERAFLEDIRSIPAYPESFRLPPPFAAVDCLSRPALP